MENRSWSTLLSNRPTSGGYYKKDLLVGKTRQQLYSNHSLSSLSLSSLSPTPNSISMSGLRAKENGAGGAFFGCLTSFVSCCLGRPGMGSPGFQSFGIGSNLFNSSVSIPFGMESGFVSLRVLDGLSSIVASGT